jgi:hypothetical protein
MVFGVQKKGVIVEGQVSDPVAKDPITDLLDHPIGLPPYVALRKEMGGTVSAAKRTPFGSGDAGVRKLRIEIKGRKKALHKGIRCPMNRRKRIDIEKPADRPESAQDFASLEHEIGAAIAFCMVLAKGGIDAPENNRNRSEGIFHSFDNGKKAWIPVGHTRCDGDEVRFSYGTKPFLKGFLRNPVTTIMPRKES